MEEKPTVYLETTIPSYLTAWPSSSLVTAGEQAVTRQWWERRRKAFDLYISQLLVEEDGRGDPEAARRRLTLIRHLEELEIDEEVVHLTNALLESSVFPKKAAADAGHIAVAS